MAEVKLGLRNIAYNMDRFCTWMLKNAKIGGFYRKIKQNVGFFGRGDLKKRSQKTKWQL